MLSTRLRSYCRPFRPSPNQSFASFRNNKATMAMNVRFNLTKESFLVVDQGDITQFQGDAIVNAANEQCLGGGGVDGAIHRAAGPKLRQECESLKQITPTIRCPAGKAVITGSHDLPGCKHIIHTVGPIYRDKSTSEPVLYSAYKNSLDLANEHDLETVAFPAISCGVYGYPIEDAAEVAIKACRENVGNLKKIVLMQFSSRNFDVFRTTAAQMLNSVA